jgi:hypothetical protein
MGGSLSAAKRYLAICNWAAKRYTRNGLLVLDVGRKPAPYSRIESAAWKRYSPEFNHGG